LRLVSKQTCLFWNIKSKALFNIQKQAIVQCDIFFDGGPRCHFFHAFGTQTNVLVLEYYKQVMLNMILFLKESLFVLFLRKGFGVTTELTHGHCAPPASEVS
jgi:hypothetical protein